MNDQDRARPVSGEIMADARTRTVPRREPGDFSEADYEIVGDGGGPARSVPRPEPAAASSGMDFLKPGATAAENGAGRGGALFWTAGLMLVALTFWVSGGHALVRQHATMTAELREPLRIAEVRSRVESHNGRDVLFVEGRAENHAAGPHTLPPIEIAVTGNDGERSRYFLGTSGTELRPGERYAFSSRTEAPRNGVKSVSVAFGEVAR